MNYKRKQNWKNTVSRCLFHQHEWSLIKYFDSYLFFPSKSTNTKKHCVLKMLGIKIYQTLSYEWKKKDEYNCMNDL